MPPNKKYLFTPGPAPVPPEVLLEMARPIIHHRTPEFRAMYTKVLAQLKEFVGTENDVLLLACSGTGAIGRFSAARLAWARLAGQPPPAALFEDADRRDAIDDQHRAALAADLSKSGHRMHRARRSFAGLHQ